MSKQNYGLPTDLTFGEIEQLYLFMKRHTVCRENYNKEIGSGLQYNRCYTAERTSDGLIVAYKVTCLGCKAHEFICDLDSV